jgi:hypothetical protein
MAQILVKDPFWVALFGFFSELVNPESFLKIP